MTKLQATAVSAKELARAVARVGKVKVGTTFKELGAVHLSVARGVLNVTRTNLEHGVTVKVPTIARGAKESTALVGFDEFKKITKSLAGKVEMVTLREIKEGLTVSAGPTSFTLMSLDLSKYPELPIEPPQFTVAVDREATVEALGKVSYAASGDPTRYNLSGVFLDPKSGQFVATDGHRMAVTPAPKGFEGLHLPPFGMILPGEFVRDLEKNATGDEIMFSEVIGSPFIFASYEATTVFCRVIDGEYPNWRQVVPTKTDFRGTLDRAALIDGCEQVGIVANGRTMAAKVKVDIAGRVEIETNNGDAKGSWFGGCPDHNHTGIEFAVSLKYLLAALKHLSGDSVRLEASDGLSPMLLSDPAAEEGYAVVMPMRM